MKEEWLWLIGSFVVTVALLLVEFFIVSRSFKFKITERDEKINRQGLEIDKHKKKNSPFLSSDGRDLKIITEHLQQHNLECRQRTASIPKIGAELAAEFKGIVKGASETKKTNMILVKVDPAAWDKAPDETKKAIVHRAATLWGMLPDISMKQVKDKYLHAYVAAGQKIVGYVEGTFKFGKPPKIVITKTADSKKNVDDL